MSLLRPAGSNYTAVVDIAAACSWYIEKLGLQKISVALDDGENCIALGFSEEEPAFVLGPPSDAPRDELSAMLYTSKLKKAREVLISRGVNVGEIQQDRQGTHYFEMRDPEGNVVEISEEP